jgi:serine/threonine protein kinase/tetratricopeptide (TPR) repeat protein
MNAARPDNEAIFHAARAIPDPDRRREYVHEACGGDEARIAHVEALLAAADRPDSLLDHPAEGTPAATIEPPTTESPGTVIGPYKLLQQIGEGGMATVWMAEQTQPVKRLVAVKLIKAGMDSKQVIARFEAERQALALMDHPNIARVLDGGTTSAGRPYFVMDLVKGVPITRYCDEHRLTPRQRLELFIPVCQAIQHAHQKGIIHRDLKPSNVLVALYDGKPVPKVIDFGVAKAAGKRLTDKTLFTGFGALVGTLEYMSPEQAEINQLDVDTRSDIYSLGVLLYELLTGSPPLSRKELEKGSILEMLRVIREQEPPRPSTKLSTAEGLPTLAANRGTEPAKLTKLVRGELDWIVMKALEKDRSRRYETASAFAADVQRYLSDEPVQACPPSAGYRFRKFARRNRAALAMASLALVSLIAFTVAGLLAYRNRLTEEDRLAEQKEHEERLLAEKRQNALEKALMAAISGDFDGAENAIGEAELLGASAGQLRMLRGQVAFHRGDVPAATRELEQAVRLLPESVAARAMLALAYYNGGQTALMEEAWQHLDRMTPSTPEDFLFLGQIEAILRPDRSLQTLDEAVRRRHSAIAHAVRADARANRALFSGLVSDAESALDDTQAARVMLPDNPFVLGRSVFAQLVAAGIYEDKGQTQDRERVLVQARRDVQELKQFTALPVALKACFWYFNYVGNDDAAFEMSRRGPEFRYAWMLYRRKDYAQALQAVDRAVAQGIGWSRVERAFILTELPNGLERAGDQLQDAQTKESRLGRVAAPMIPLLLRRGPEAVQASRKIRSDPALLPPWALDWYLRYLDYHCGTITGEELLQTAGTCRPKLCEAHFAIGLHCLAEGNREGAKEHFRKCGATRVFIYWDHMWARAFLDRLEKEPSWPAWIPLKK